MDPRDFIRSNGYVEPGIFSVGQIFLNLVPGTNWVSSQPSFVVTLDPQIDAGPTHPRDASKLDVGLLERGARRRLMSELANEFAAMHDDLLRELAR